MSVCFELLSAHLLMCLCHLPASVLRTSVCLAVLLLLVHLEGCSTHSSALFLRTSVYLGALTWLAHSEEHFGALPFWAHLDCSSYPLV
ncbi:hypothetical protein B0J14DRAFT_604719 [Halenospora varia]|nr:hypothetical protein B0J14DRAFT_604719 [Halenospora varia]